MIALRHRLLSALFWILVIVLFAPVLFMAVMGLKDGAYIGLPIRAWSLKWYENALTDNELRKAFLYSVKVSVLSTLLSVILGVWIAVLHKAAQGLWKPVIFALVFLPMVVPNLIGAIALRIFTQSIALPAGTTALTLGLATYGVPFVFVTVSVRLASLPLSQIEAARDLGCDAFTAFWRVTFPWIVPALAAASVFTMLSGFDDFVRALFLSGYNQTIALFIYNKITNGLSPFVPAVASLVVLFSIGAGFFGETLLRLNQKVKS